MFIITRTTCIVLLVCELNTVYGDVYMSIIGELSIADEGVKSHANMIKVSAIIEDREWVPNLLIYSKLNSTQVLESHFLNECLEQYKKFLIMSDKHPELMTAFVPPVRIITRYVITMSLSYHYTTTAALMCAIYITPSLHL